MLTTATLNIADLTTDSLQVSDSSSNFVSAAKPEGTFASLMVPLPEPDVLLVPPSTGEALPADGESLPALTDILPTLDDGTDPALPAATTDAFLDQGETGPTVEIPETDDPLDALANVVDARLLRNEQSHRNSRLHAELAADRTEFAGRDSRIPIDQPVLRPDRLATTTPAAAGSSLPELTSTTGRADADIPRTRLPETMSNRRLEVDPHALRAGQERAVTDIAREQVLMPELATSRDAGELTIKTAVTTPGHLVSGFAESGLLRDVGAAAKGSHTVVTTIDRPVLDDAWGESLQDRVLWMTGRKIQSAEIRLNPAEMGPIRVQVSVQDDAAVLNFTAQHAVTREAIEQALPRLREMLSENGLTLAGTTVSDSGEDRGSKDKSTFDGTVPPEKDLSTAGETEAEQPVVSRTDIAGLVDTFV